MGFMVYGPTAAKSHTDALIAFVLTSMDESPVLTAAIDTAYVLLVVDSDVCVTVITDAAADTAVTVELCAAMPVFAEAIAPLCTASVLRRPSADSASTSQRCSPATRARSPAC
jgi:hypothetical protein